MVVLYSTNSPICMSLEKKIIDKHIPYLLITGTDALTLIKEKGYNSAPLLENDNIVMTYESATQWIKNLGGSK